MHSLDLLLTCFCSKSSSTKCIDGINGFCCWEWDYKNNCPYLLLMGMDIPCFWRITSARRIPYFEIFFMIIPILRLVPCCRHKVQFQIQKAWCTTEGAWQVTVYSLLLPKFCVHSDSHWRHFFSMVYTSFNEVWSTLPFMLSISIAKMKLQMDITSTSSAYTPISRLFINSSVTMTVMYSVVTWLRGTLFIFGVFTCESSITLTSC